MFFCNAVFSQSTSKICTLFRLFIFSNKAIYYTISGLVLLPYRFTLFSHWIVEDFMNALVLLPYRFTLFSNILRSGHTCILFYYLIDLHYSQTLWQIIRSKIQFYYLIDLHYSQTELCGDDEYNKVLLPYRFTLFSNPSVYTFFHHFVLLPYRFTLFSNERTFFWMELIVLLPYRFTLFSNIGHRRLAAAKFYYLIDLHYSQTVGI